MRWENITGMRIGGELLAWLANGLALHRDSCITRCNAPRPPGKATPPEERLMNWPAARSPLNLAFRSFSCMLACSIRWAVAAL